jgi:5-methylcytosine-specific restriction endonuclease McrA
MMRLLPKRPRLRLPPKAYRQLHRKILERDGWRCQACGSMENLQVHHMQFRSHSGADDEVNLITLCADCHMLVHNGRINDRR